jgi:hypothetical protein
MASLFLSNSFTQVSINSKWFGLEYPGVTVKLLVTRQHLVFGF